MTPHVLATAQIGTAGGRMWGMSDNSRRWSRAVPAAGTPARGRGPDARPLLDAIEAEVRDGPYALLRAALAERSPAGARILLEELTRLVRAIHDRGDG